MSVSFKILSALVATLQVSTAFAALNSLAPRGEKIVNIAVAGRNPEICVIPKHMNGAAYSEKDLKNEQELCAMNEYENVAFCPKVSSTNPGVIVSTVPKGYTAQQVEAANCKIEDPTTKKDLAKKVAKYKLSTSCSYSPAILAYYHVSRLLGGIGNVPVSVLRTLDLKKHLAIGKKALALAPRNDIIYQTWAGLYSQLAAGASASRRDLLMTSKFDQSYGALLDSKKGDFYKEFFNGGADNLSRAVNFRDRNGAAILMAKKADISQIVPRAFTAANVQNMIRTKDASDMIVLDTLLNQQDRFGNIDVKETYAYLERSAPDAAPVVKISNKLEAEEITKLGAVPVKQMMLNDNDCGVAKDNIAKKAKLADRISHIDPNTYYRLLKLHYAIDNADVQNFFLTELNFTRNDLAGFRQNVKELAQKLYASCKAGNLRLDLDIQKHFSGQPLEKLSCEPQK